MTDAQLFLSTISGHVSILAVNVLIQSTALAVLFLLAARFLKRKGAAVQSAVPRAGLAAVLSCPFISLALGAAGVEGLNLPLPETALIRYTPPSLPAELVLRLK